MPSLFESARVIFRQKDFVVLLGCSLLLGLGYSFVIPFLSIFGTKEVGMSPVSFGVFMTITSLAAIVVSTWISRYSDTVLSRKVVLVLGGSSGALGYLGYAYVRDYWLLMGIGMVFLAVASVSFGQIFAYARDLLGRSEVPHAEVPLYMNVFRLFFALAWTVGPACAAWIMTTYSFQGTFLVAALLFALFTATVYFAVPEIPPSPESRAAAESLPLSQVLKIPGLTLHLVGFALYFACSTMAMMNLPLLILNSLGGTSVEVGWAYSVAPLFELPLMFFMGVVATKRDHSWLIRVALVVAVFYYAGLAIVGSPVQVYLLQILSAFVVAVMSGVAITFFQNFLPHQSGSSTNLYSTASRVGGTVGYLSFGFLTADWGHRAVFFVCAAMTLLSFLILYVARPRALPVPAQATG